MTTEFCADDVLVQLTSPQVFSEAACSTSASLSTTRAQTSSVAVELGRSLLLAARAGDTATVLELMAKGAPFTTDWLGTSPLHLAAANNHVETCAVLLRAGVSRDARTKVERTPLHMAAHAGNSSVITLLINHGASIDCRDMLQMTPLHWAAARGHVAAVQELLDAGANRSVLCKFRKTPRDLALRNLRPDIVELLDHFPEQTPEEPVEESQSDFAVLQKIDETITTKNPQKDKTVEIEIKHEPSQKSKVPIREAETSDAAQLLKRHGITLLPADHGGTVLTALQSGRTVVLSDAGKLMLQESTVPSPLPPMARGKGSPARALKVLAVNKLLAVGDKQAQHYQPVKLVQLGGGRTAAAATSAAAAARQPVKIVLNKQHFHKLVSVSKHNGAATTAAQNISVKMEQDVIEKRTNIANFVESETDACRECERLRAELSGARAQIAALRDQLARVQR